MDDIRLSIAIHMTLLLLTGSFTGRGATDKTRKKDSEVPAKYVGGGVEGGEGVYFSISLNDR